MALTSEKIAQGLVFTAMGRRAQAPLRLFVAVVLAISFHAELNIGWLWGWLGAYLAAQVFELWALWPFRPDRPHPKTWRAVVALVSLFTLAATFGVIAIPLWLAHGSLGPAGAVLLLAGSILNVLSLSRGSPLAFMAGAVPYASYLVSAPLIERAVNGADPFSVPFILAELLFLTAAVLVYVAAERLAESQKKVAAELDARRADAVADAESKSRFVAVVSHELRTPLSGILAAASDLQRRSTDPQLRSRAAMVIQGARMMRTILDDLLDLAKLEAGKMGVEAVPFDPKLMIEDVALFWSSEAERKGLDLILTGAETLPEVAEGDPLRLRQVMNNLLSNAVKFTDAGSIRIEAGIREIGERLLLSIAVVDTGRGLTSEKQAALFQPFEQGDASVARTHGGTGLGLAISRQLARLMGGDLVADGAPGAGCRFTLTALLKKSTARLPIGPDYDAPANGDAPARILVVDDHDIGRRALAMILEPLGASITQARNAEESLRLLASAPFDLVLMDVTMEGVDGLEACRRLRRSGGPNSHVPVLAVTGLTERVDLDAARAAGMNGHVPKPVEPRVLYDAIERVLSGDETEDDAEAVA